jgi:hypothetical protein
MRHVRYSNRPPGAHSTSWGGVLKTLILIAAFAYLVWWLVGVVQGDAALVDWLPGS